MPRLVLRDHYLVLGVSDDATEAQIKKAFRDRAKELHPDKLGPDVSDEEIHEAEDLFKEAAEAYNILSDDEKRSELDSWLSLQRLTDTADYASGCNGQSSWEEPVRQHSEPPPVPAPVRFEHEGVWVYVIYGLNYWSDQVTATVQVSIKDVFTILNEPELPHAATITQYEVVDAKGDIVGRGHSLQSMRDKYRRFRAEENRNWDRRNWKNRLSELRSQRDELELQGKPVSSLNRLIREAERKEGGAFQWEYSDSVTLALFAGFTQQRKIDPRGHRYGHSRDSVVQAIRAVEIELERLRSFDLAEVLLTDLLAGKVTHPDVRVNNQIIADYDLLTIRSGGELPAYTEEAVREHYRARLQGISFERELLFTNLRLPDEREFLWEMISEGAIELAPDKIKLLGSKNKTSDYPVLYRFDTVGGKRVPVGEVTVPLSVYQKHGYRSGII